MSDPIVLDTTLILKTKLYPPRVTSDLVPRVALLKLLQQNQQRPFTLISAPAGYGKSILASMWLEASDLPGGWVSLDDSDNDLHTFVSYLLAAIDTVVPHTSSRTDALLSNLASVPATTLTRTLLTALDQIETPFLLILDDIHRIHEQRIINLLESLLKHPSPALHLVLVGRQDPPLPIASLRAYDQITEIRMRNLRFTTQETSQFLCRMLQRDIDEPMAADWTAKTEGWIVALRLAALSFRYRPQPTTLDVYVPGNNQFLQEFLVTEVLAQLPDSLQNCLLKTALLDRFCASLCAALCLTDDENGRLKMTGEQFMQWLQQSNLFLINLDSQNEWFRFHHLFQADLKQLLEKQFSPQEIAALHLRASKWFAENGIIADAIREALVAGDTPTAIDLFSQHRYTLMEQEQWHQLANLLKLFPDETIRENLVLLTTGALNAFSMGWLSKFLIRHRQIEYLLACQPPDATMSPAILGEIGVLHNLNAFIIGSPVNVVKNAQKSVELLPSQAHYLRGFAFGSQIAALQMEGKLHKANLLAKEAITNPTCPPQLQIFIYFCLTIANFMEGDLINVLQVASKVVRLAMQTKKAEEYYRGCYFIGVAHYLRNELDEAERYLLKVIDHPEQASASYMMFSGCALMSIYYAQKRAEEATLLFQKIRDYVEETENTINLVTLNAFQVEFTLNQNQIANAHRLGLTVDFNIRPLLWFHYIPQLTPLKLLLQQGDQQNLAEVKAQLARMDEHLRQINRKVIQIDVLAMQALLFYAQNESQSACQKLCDSLVLAAPGGFIKNYLDFGEPMAELLTLLSQQTEFRKGDLGPYVAKILGAFPNTSTANGKDVSPPFVSIEPLTKRELETLEFLATDLSTKEIATEMNISWTTTRTHIKNVYAKLSVHGRYEAIQRAHELELF